MDGYKLGVVETRFAELIWQHEPLTSGELVKLCEQELQWKKSTTDTFDGSLPAFLAAFTTRKSLSEKDIAEIQRMIDRCGKE